MAVTQVLAALSDELVDAWMQVSSTSSLYNAEHRANALHWLSVDQERLERLRHELLDQARAGTLPFSSWAEIAKQTHEDIAFQVGLTGTWSFTGILGSAVAETKAEVVDAVDSVGGGAGVGAIAGVAFGLFLVWQLR